MVPLTCAVCGTPLSPENAYRCSECGHIVCASHIRWYKGRRICTTCYRKHVAAQEPVIPRRKEELVLELATIEF